MSAYTAQELPDSRSRQVIAEYLEVKLMQKLGWAMASMTFAAVAACVRALRHMSFRDRVVLITGSSRGLGLVMARQLAAKKAKLVIIARDQEELKIAEDDLRARGADVLSVQCDITNKAEVDELTQRIQHRYGRLDVVINNAGIIQVGPFETQTLQDYEDAMRSHFWGPLNVILAAVPLMKEQKQGRIVNIVSIGGLISVPHLLPYSASKFALEGLSEGLRAELAKHNILVTTVCPGMMRTGSHQNANFKGQNELEFAWFSLGNAMPVISISAEEAAKQILTACQRGDAYLTLTLPAQVAAKLHGAFPGMTSEVLTVVNALLPGPGGIGTRSKTGQESHSSISPSAMTVMSDVAAASNNELSLSQTPQTETASAS